MKVEQIEARQALIQDRVAELKAERARLKKFQTFSKSSFFRGGLAGDHPFLTPAEDRDEYLARQKTFAPEVEEQLAALLDESRNLPPVSGQRWDRPRSLKIGIIADRFLYDSLKDAARLIPITPQNFAEQLEDVDLLLITSAWRGLDGEWLNLPLPNVPARQVLEESVVPLAREKGVPVAFYSKEDPPNFQKFSGIARLAEHVFTSAVECVPQYKELLGDEIPVDVLGFSVNYVHHNPLGCMRHQGRELVFAGSWFEHKYPERRNAAQKIFDGLIEAGADLTIIDRNLALDSEKVSRTERYLYPERYLPHLHGPIDHEALLGMQRLLPLGINLNSVIASQTMFANRVIEMQAMGTMVISNYNAGVNSQFPQVTTPDSAQDVAGIYGSLTRHTVRDAQVAGIRAAYSSNTAFDRIDELIAALGLPDESPSHVVYVHGLAEDEFDALSASQRCRARIEHVSDDDVARIRASHDGDVLVYMNGVADVGPHLIQDIVNGYRFGDADVVAVRDIDDDRLYEYIEPETIGYGISAVWVPQGTVLGDARAEARSAIAIASEVAPVPTPPSGEPASPELSIVVPVYNNGPHLKFKCFESIRRSSVFDKSEILLVDDGSTDVETVWIVDELAARYENARVFRFEAGGSGSASRPRNKGLELARAPYVTYLDPDNELTNDGFALLLGMVKDEDLDFAIGNMVRWKDKRTTVKNSAVLKQVVGPDGILEPDALSKANYQPMSIQALVARTEWLKGTGIYQPVGAVGQDSYFFQQMLFYARKIRTTIVPIHTYYAAVAKSTVNSIGPRFYEKYLPLEKDRAQWLRDVGLLDDYIDRRLEKFVKGWFIQKLNFVAPEDQQRCRELIFQLVAFYDVQSWQDPELAEFFSRGAHV